MIIAGSSYCESAGEKLKIGTYFDLIAEPENPFDSNAIMLVCDGEKIGYVPRKDTFAFTVSLKMKRNIYGVITGINENTVPTQYEFEAWFDMSEK